MKHKAHLTAIGRKTLPLPTKWLLSQGFLREGRFLDFGCGKCHGVNNQHFNADGYDPHWEFPQTDLAVVNGTQYDVIISNYVMCVLPPKERRIALKTIQSHLKKDGVAYVTVRTDKPRQGWGMSSKGTYQGRVTRLPGERIHKTKDFAIYRLTRDTDIDKVITR